MKPQVNDWHSTNVCKHSKCGAVKLKRRHPHHKVSLTIVWVRIAGRLLPRLAAGRWQLICNVIRDVSACTVDVLQNSGSLRFGNAVVQGDELQNPYCIGKGENKSPVVYLRH